MITLNSRWQDFVDACWTKTAADNGFTKETDCEGIIAGRNLGDITFGEALKLLTVEKGWRNGWTAWMCLHMLDQMDTKAREEVIKFIGVEAPQWAAIVFRRCEKLTDEEDAVLLQAMRSGQMVDYVAKYDLGILTREKTSIGRT